jgi:CDP-2,3-bis-(O-geranylgeranyl)-sn-glycerol synthase
MTGAFIKRRLGMKRGQKAPVLDQYDFVTGALLLTALFFPDWVAAHYVNDGAIVALIALLVFVPVLHRSVNIIGYKLGKKKEPW